ncbi:MAG TPA: phosphatidylserine decarboxylase family protein [bacterium]|nr:phosphatidylserine decarboxylase family protein [bacterium]
MLNLNRYKSFLLIIGIMGFISLIISLRAKTKISIVFLCIFTAVFLLLLFFFRNPYRKVIVNKNRVLAPCDGKIISIERPENNRVQIYVFLSIFDVHRFRNPVSGKVIKIEYKKGKFYKAFNRAARKENESNKIAYKIGNGNMIYITQIAGYIARRIFCDLRERDIVQQGDLFGMISFGSGCLIDIPSNYTVKVKLRSKIKAGKNIIAEIAGNN